VLNELYHKISMVVAMYALTCRGQICSALCCELCRSLINIFVSGLASAGGNEVVGGMSAVLYSCTILLMMATVTAVVLLFLLYAQPTECLINKLFIGINSLLCVFICVISVLPCIIKSQLLPASLSLHCAFM